MPSVCFWGITVNRRSKIEVQRRLGPVDYEKRIIALIKSDSLRMRALRAVRTLELPDWMIAAGFVRNKIWCSIYGNEVELNDIDVIYYCPSDDSEERDVTLEKLLRALEPDLPWSVKNQARMHFNNGDLPYIDSLDAMSHWPEKQTAIGVMLEDTGQIALKHSFPLELQFNGMINHNPARKIEIFKRRIKKKGWLEIWPELRLKIETKN